MNAEKELSNNPVKFDNFEMKKKMKDKWLGEILHEDGLAASVHATILDREGKVKGAIREAIAIMEDFRMQKIGGLMGGIDLWEVAIIPSLLNNAETWVEINEMSVTLLEELQNSFIRKIFRTKKTTPKVALTFETGMLPMRLRIMMRKLIFVNDLKMMDTETLAHQVYSEQVKYGFPGLAREAESMCQELDLPNIVRVNVDKQEWKGLVKRMAVKKHSEQLDKELEEGYSKLKDIRHEGFGCKEYLETKVIEKARMAFQIRTKMLDFKANYKNDYKYKAEKWKCEACGEEMETQAHVLQCLEYSKLREGRNMEEMEDQILYFQEVIKIRMKK